MERLTIHGLKYVSGLSLLRQPGCRGGKVAELTRRLAGSGINLVFLDCPVQSDQSCTACLCLEQEKAEEALVIAREIADTHGLPAPEVLSGVAALTIFPLGQSFSLTARIMASLAGAGLTPIRLGTSLAAVVTLIYEADLESALKAIRKGFNLTGDLSPPDERIRVVQTSRGLRK